MTLIFERKFPFFCTKAQRLNQYSKFISFKNGKMLLKQHYHGTDRFGKETASFPMSPINAKRTGNILRPPITVKYESCFWFSFRRNPPNEMIPYDHIGMVRYNKNSYYPLTNKRIIDFYRYPFK